MMCGATISRIQPDAIFRLEAPCRLSEDATTQPDTEGFHHWFETGQGLMQIGLHWSRTS
jgi:hypothetical protein